MSCPGRTKMCEKVCYAKKASRRFPAAEKRRADNFALSRTPEFIATINSAIAKAKGRIDTLRIHESGDFYNQQYFDKWVAIASINPGLKFYAYTKSWFLDISNKPNNFTLIFSVDKTSIKKAPLGIDGFAVMVEDRKPRLDVNYGDIKLCYDVKNNRHLKCKDGCNYCYSGDKEKMVIFFKH